MRYSRFLSFSLVGGAGWIVFITMAGYLLGQVAVIRQNFEKVVLLIIFLSLVPVLIEALKHRRGMAVRDRAAEDRVVNT
jgi:membrane-associated protein